MSQKAAARLDAIKASLPEALKYLKLEDLHAAMTDQADGLSEEDSGHWVRIALPLSIAEIENGLFLWLKGVRNVVPHQGGSLAWNNWSPAAQWQALYITPATVQVSQVLLMYVLPPSAYRHMIRSLCRYLYLLASLPKDVGDELMSKQHPTLTQQPIVYLLLRILHAYSTKCEGSYIIWREEGVCPVIYDYCLTRLEDELPPDQRTDIGLCGILASAAGLRNLDYVPPMWAPKDYTPGAGPPRSWNWEVFMNALEFEELEVTGCCVACGELGKYPPLPR